MVMKATGEPEVRTATGEIPAAGRMVVDRDMVNVMSIMKDSREAMITETR